MNEVKLWSHDKNVDCVEYRNRLNFNNLRDQNVDFFYIKIEKFLR